MKVKVLKKHFYGVKEHRVDDTYEITSRSHFRVLHLQGKIMLADETHARELTADTGNAPEQQNQPVTTDDKKTSEKPKKSNSGKGRSRYNHRSMFASDE